MIHELDPDALYWVSFNRFEFRMRGEAVQDIARSGQNDEAVAYHAPRVVRYEWGESHPWAPTPDRVREELREYGALADDSENWRRIVWIAAWNIADSDEEPDCSEPATMEEHAA